MTEDRFFYHSFPRRHSSAKEEIDKGCLVLEAIRDFGLILMPEQIEWKQRATDGSERTFPILQKRVCFTELSPSELPQHSERFGHFALEFDGNAVRSLGAIPVFYLPHPTSDTDGNALGVALFGIVSDAAVVLGRMACLDQTFKGSAAVADKLGFQPSFAGSPEGKGSYTLDSKEAQNFLQAIGHATTPWKPLSDGMQAVLNFFYPADDVKRDKILDYYRQREWRVACAFEINGDPVTRSVSEPERERLLAIDRDFFSRTVKTDLGEHGVLDLALVHPGVGDRTIVDLVRRVIVPAAAVDQVRSSFASLPKPPEVISADDLATQTGR